MIETWILCPACDCKTRVRIREDTVLENFPLYCPKCKHETLISARQLNISIIKEPDAQPIIARRFSLQLRQLAERRAEFLARELRNLNVEELKALLSTLKEDSRTFEQK